MLRCAAPREVSVEVFPRSSCESGVLGTLCRFVCILNARLNHLIMFIVFNHSNGIKNYLSLMELVLQAVSQYVSVARCSTVQTVDRGIVYCSSLLHPHPPQRRYQSVPLRSTQKRWEFSPVSSTFPLCSGIFIFSIRSSADFHQAGV